MERPFPVRVQQATAFSDAGQHGRQPVGGQLALVVVLVGLAGLAWVATDLRMAGMDAGPGTPPGRLGFFVSTWVVMMAAMMFPATAPMVITYRNLHERRSTQGPRAGAADTGLFVAGYLAIWAAAGLVGYAALASGRSLDGGLFAWDRAGRWTAAGMLLTAALYELTPHKRACLTRCRNPRGFLLERWRDDGGGALRMGIQHGAWCLGCCWALTAGLFALGAMSLVWIVLISALITAERLAKRRTLATFAVASVLAALAIGVAAAPAQVPALTIPGSPAAMRAMNPTEPMAHQTMTTNTKEFP